MVRMIVIPNISHYQVAFSASAGQQTSQWLSGPVRPREDQASPANYKVTVLEQHEQVLSPPQTVL